MEEAISITVLYKTIIAFLFIFILEQMKTSHSRYFININVTTCEFCSGQFFIVIDQTKHSLLILLMNT